ncbi:hypothetical protein ACFZCU_43950 [Streptomyces canus]|jgi:hypothetical protein|uniref:hypothetical protein n=1 Tax=Streptomyces canus TaxID=58343 RepID=UPI0036EE444F
MARTMGVPRSLAAAQNPEEGCGEPLGLAFTDNTLLPPRNPGQACAANTACAAVLANAGPPPSHRQRLGML